MRALDTAQLLLLLSSPRILALGLATAPSSSWSDHLHCCRPPHPLVLRPSCQVSAPSNLVPQGPRRCCRRRRRQFASTSLHFVNPANTMASSASSTTTTAVAVHLEQFAPQAVNLFNNMKTPASILAGALVPLGLLAPLPDTAATDADKSTNKKESTGSTKTTAASTIRLLVPRILRRSYVVVAVLSLLSELISVMWATVAVNQLIETHVAPAESVWHLLRRDYDLAWLGTNAHFVAGMFGFSYVIALRASLGHAGPVGKAVSSFALASLLLMVAIVNRGVSSGSGDGMRYGSSVASLFSSYLKTLFRRATHKDTFGPLEVGSMLVFAWGAVASVVAVIKAATDDVKGK